MLQKQVAEEGVREKIAVTKPTTSSAVVVVKKVNPEADMEDADCQASRKAARKAAKLAEKEKAAAKLETMKAVREAVPKAVQRGQEVVGLDEFLVGLNLDKYAAGLRDELGAAIPTDLKDLDEGDMDELGLKKLEKRRLLRALMEL